MIGKSLTALLINNISLFLILEIPLLVWIEAYFGVSVIAGFRVSDMKPFLYDIYFMLKRNLF